MTQRFEERVALVTGGAAGIGAATARRFISEGARVLLADRDEALGKQVVNYTRTLAIDHARDNIRVTRSVPVPSTRRSPRC